MDWKKLGTIVLDYLKDYGHHALLLFAGWELKSADWMVFACSIAIWALINEVRKYKRQ